MFRPKHGGNIIWAASVACCPASSIVDFSASINPLGPPQSAIAAITNSVNSLAAYPDPEYSSLKLALAEYHQLNPAYILPGNGSAELLTWAGRELAQQNVTYLITPAFGDYYRALKTFQANIHTCPLFDAEGQVSTQLLIPDDDNFAHSGLLINNPHNPTGKLWHREDLRPYLDQFALVVVDEAFMDFLTPEQEQSLINLVVDFPNLVILRSLTKFYSLPGLRIGYAITHPARIRRWQEWRDPWSVNILAANAAEAAIQDKSFQKQTWQWLKMAKEELFDNLSAIKGLKPIPSAANFILTQTVVPSNELQLKLLRQKQILIRDCLSFSELGSRYFRIAVRTSADNLRLVEALTANV